MDVFVAAYMITGIIFLPIIAYLMFRSIIVKGGYVAQAPLGCLKILSAIITHFLMLTFAYTTRSIMYENIVGIVYLASMILSIVIYWYQMLSDVRYVRFTLITLAIYLISVGISFWYYYLVVQKFFF